MNILNESTANEPLINGTTPNPKFFGSVATTGAPTTVTVTPDPIKQVVTVTPPSIVKDGVTVTFPPYAQEVTLQPPAVQVTIPGTAGAVKNVYDSVGVINFGGQVRLCALVRPNVIAAAHHYNNSPYAPYIGMTVAFFGVNGIESAVISGVILTRDDFECYRLDRAITGVQPAEIAPLEPDSYIGRSFVVFGLANASKPVAAMTTMKYAFAQGAGWIATCSNKLSMPAVVERGDSGSPAFLVIDGRPRYFGSLASINLTTFQVNMAPPHAKDILSL
jgi:hypothetical protein